MAKDDKRLFAPFPIEMDEHPKIIGLSDAAFRAVFEATFYSRRMLSDGFLDERVVLRRWGQAVADELASNDPNRPSWIRVEGGWRIHDFEKHHPLRAEIEAGRLALSEKRSQAGRKGAASRWQADSKPVANDSSETETETETETSPSNEGDSARKRAHSIPKTFSISPEMRAWAATETPLVDIDAKLPEFIDFWTGTGKAMKDWVATWRNGMRKQQGFAERDRAPRTNRDDENMAVVARLAAQEQRGIEA